MSVSTLQAIREQIKVILTGVSGTGVIHDYERWSSDWSTFLDHYKDADGKINGCVFAREKWDERQYPIRTAETSHIILFRRVMGLNDAQATGIIFDEHLELMRDAFRSNKTLNGTCFSINPEWGQMAGAVGLQAGIIEPRLFGKVLCHFAEMRLCAVERNPY